MAQRRDPVRSLGCLQSVFLLLSRKTKHRRETNSEWDQMQLKWLKHFGREPKRGANAADWLPPRDRLGPLVGGFGVWHIVYHSNIL